MHHDETWIEVKVAALRLDCSVRTIARLIHCGVLVAVDRGGGRINHGWRIDPASVRAIKNKTVK